MIQGRCDIPSIIIYTSYARSALERLYLHYLVPGESDLIKRGARPDSWCFRKLCQVSLLHAQIARISNIFSQSLACKCVCTLCSVYFRVSITCDYVFCISWNGWNWNIQIMFYAYSISLPLYNQKFCGKFEWLITALTNRTHWFRNFRRFHWVEWFRITSKAISSNCLRPCIGIINPPEHDPRYIHALLEHVTWRGIFPDLKWLILFRKLIFVCTESY